MFHVSQLLMNYQKGLKMEESKNLSTILKNRYRDIASEDLAGLGDWLHRIGKAGDALLYSILFMPEFILLEDSVLLSWNLSSSEMREKFLKNLAKEKHSRKMLEASYNFIEIGYIFDAGNRDTSDVEDEALAKLIKKAWESWLQTCYPNRKFTVELLSPEETGSTVGIQFYELR